MKKKVFLLIYESLWQLFLTLDHFFFNRIHTLLLCNSLLPNLSHFQWSIGFSFHFLAKFTKNLENLIERKRLSIQCQLKWLKEQLEYIFWEKITQLHLIIIFHFTQHFKFSTITFRAWLSKNWNSKVKENTNGMVQKKLCDFPSKNHPTYLVHSLIFYQKIPNYINADGIFIPDFYIFLSNYK